MSSVTKAQIMQVLDPLTLVEEAQKIAGLSDYGSLDFIELMHQHLERAVAEVDFTEHGIDDFKNLTLRFLVNRLRLQNDLKQHPEILQEDVSDPIIIIGLPRSGTTKLQRMMAAAPEVQKLYMWRLLNPAPFTDAVASQPDPRMSNVGLGDLMVSDSQEVKAAHAMALGNVDEEFVLFDYTLDPSVGGFHLHIPLFYQQDWAASKSDREADHTAYNYVKILLQYLQWQDGGSRGRPWILKAVMHLPHLESLLASFPKATIIHCHRNPHQAIPSMAKLQWAAWSSRATVKKEFVGQGFVDWGAKSVSRYLETRARLQLDERIIDAHYEDIRSNILPIIEAAYKRSGREFTAAAKQAMLQWEQDNEQGKHGQHSYSLAEFGLSEAMLNEAFSDYIERFINK